MRDPERLGEDDALEAERQATNAIAASARQKARMHGGIGSHSRDQRPSNWVLPFWATRKWRAARGRPTITNGLGALSQQKNANWNGGRAPLINVSPPSRDGTAPPSAS